MSVATKNPFAILDAEDASRPSSPAPPPAKEAAPPAPPAPTRGTQKPRGGPAARGGKYYARGGSKSGPRDTGNLNQNGIEEPPADGQRKFDSGSRGRGRGGRGGAGRGGRGRPFDRHSQTGKTDTDKRIHQSWGGDDGNTELKTAEAVSNDVAVEGAATTDWGPDATPASNDWGATETPGDDPWATPAAAEGTAAAAATAPTADAEKPEREGRPRREREPEEEDNTLTLEQYLAQKKEKEGSLVPKLEGTRKANEGADGNIWKDVVPLQKEEENSYFVGKSKSTPKTRTKKEDKIFLEIDAHFDRPARGGRGGRGGDRGGDRARGGRGRGPARGRPNGASNPVNVDDVNAFPSLS